MREHSIRLTGPRATGARVSVRALRDLLDVLSDGARKAVRLRVEGRSTAKGIQPEWLGRAADFELVGLSEGSTRLHFEAPSLAEAVPHMFGQMDFTKELDTSRTSFELLEESLRDALAGSRESDLYDESLLKTFTGFSALFKDGFEALEIKDAGPVISLDAAGIETVSRLRRETPEPRRVMVAGKLDAIRDHDHMFTLILPDGKTIKGLAEEIESRILADFFGEPAVVSGFAHYRPSGAVLRIEADRIEKPGKNDLEIFGMEPGPLVAQLDARAYDQLQGPRSGINAIVGQWPGDETDEELAEFLECLA
ncbi:MAG: hypothetical protein KDH09_12320 [Chrysiogenetes bacterium]|nr:hypothetical protein [Chrysiogenetes bacterium]